MLRPAELNGRTSTQAPVTALSAVMRAEMHQHQRLKRQPGMQLIEISYFSLATLPLQEVLAHILADASR
jgi:hypothetical protein